MNDHLYGTLEILNKEIANMTNREQRHCRIGKLTRKLQVIPAPRVFEQHPAHPWWMQGPWCGQAVQ